MWGDNRRRQQGGSSRILLASSSSARHDRGDDEDDAAQGVGSGEYMNVRARWEVVYSSFFTCGTISEPAGILVGTGTIYFGDTGTSWHLIFYTSIHGVSLAYLLRRAAGAYCIVSSEE